MKPKVYEGHKRWWSTKNHCLYHRKEAQMIFSCEVCGGTNVQHAMWVDLNTDKIEDDYGSWCGDGNSWCCDCQEHTPITMEKKK